MHGESERRLQHLLLLHAHPHRQQQARHQAGEVAGQLDAAAFDEEVDDGEVERLAPRERQGARSGPGDVHAVSLPPQDDGEGPTAGSVSIDEKDGSHPAPLEQAAYHRAALIPNDLGGVRPRRLPAL